MILLSFMPEHHFDSVTDLLASLYLLFWKGPWAQIEPLIPQPGSTVSRGSSKPPCPNFSPHTLHTWLMKSCQDFWIWFFHLALEIPKAWLEVLGEIPGNYYFQANAWRICLVQFSFCTFFFLLEIGCLLHISKQKYLQYARAISHCTKLCSFFM